MNPIVDQFLALIIHANQNPSDFAFFPYHYKPILDIHHRISPPSPFFLFPVKKFAKGTLLCLRSRPANTMMLYDDKGGLSFYPDLFSMK